MSVQKNAYGVALERIPLPKDELLHTLRGLQEADHFQKLFQFSAFHGWLCFPNHKAIDVGNLSGMRIEDANGACNRTAPVFIMSDQVAGPGWRKVFCAADAHESVMQLLLVELLRYTYQCWFRPYRSEVDRGEFLTKVNMVPRRPLPRKTCSQEMVDSIRIWSANLCARVEDTKSREVGVDEEHAGRRLYFMQPLFRAVAVAIRASAYTIETHDISTLPVLIVRTGIEEGLSGPIDLTMITEGDRLGSVVDQSGRVSAVETKLDAAISLLMALEQREAEAANAALDPVKSTVYMTNWWVDLAAGAAEALGWDANTMGLLQGPSSSWVDEEKYPSWSGHGHESSVRYQQNCQRYRARAEICIARESASQPISYGASNSGP